VIPAPGALKPLRRPRLWLRAWWLAIAVVVAGSLVPAQSWDGMPSGSDKVEHFLAYAALAAGAVQLFATRAALLRTGAGLVAMGVLLELAQHALTSSRSMDPADALANTAGVAAGLATAWTRWRDVLLRLDGRGR
jgi:hypothetical protein